MRHLHTSNAESGFTLFELLISCSLMAVIAGIALPEFQALTASFNRLNARSYVIEDLKRAQAQTITQGCRGVFVIAADHESYSFGCDYLAYDVTDPPAPDVVAFVRDLPPNIKMITDESIIFNSRGQSVDQGDVISNVTITLTETDSGGTSTFASGTLLGTGVFTFE